MTRALKLKVPAQKAPISRIMLSGIAVGNTRRRGDVAGEGSPAGVGCMRSAMFMAASGWGNVSVAWWQTTNNKRRKEKRRDTAIISSITVE